MGNVVKRIICGHEVYEHTTYDDELNVMHDFLSRDVTKNQLKEKYWEECLKDSSVSCENLIIKERGSDGLGVHKFHISSEWGKLIGDQWIHIIEWNEDYYSITGDELLDYGCEESFENYTNNGWSESEKEMFRNELEKQARKARHRNYYDADDNTWKNYYY